MKEAKKMQTIQSKFQNQVYPLSTVNNKKDQKQKIKRVTDLLDINERPWKWNENIQSNTKDWQNSRFKNFILKGCNQFNPEKIDHIMKSELVQYGNKLWEEVFIEQESVSGNQNDTIQSLDESRYQHELSALN